MKLLSDRLPKSKYDNDIAIAKIKNSKEVSTSLLVPSKDNENKDK